jgi:exodeoxyribonuclease V alpha subunit
VGVIHAEGTRRDLALYLRTASDVRRVALGRLPAHESVYAMSVHKSQGSEFKSVAVVLPERLSPVLTRELLFTAVTRAREQVTIYGKSEVVRAAIMQRVQRESGLVDRLR